MLVAPKPSGVWPTDEVADVAQRRRQTAQYVMSGDRTFTDPEPRRFGETHAEMLDRIEYVDSGVAFRVLARLAANPDVELTREQAFRVASIAAQTVDVDAKAPETWDRESVRLEQRHKSCVYFIRHGFHIKIGTTTQTAERRLAGMQLPPGARIVAVVENADRRDEQRLHKMFASSRVHGEWFSSTPELESIIEQHSV